MSQGGLCEFWPDEIDKSLVIAESAFRTQKKKYSPASVGIHFLYHIIFSQTMWKLLFCLLFWVFTRCLWQRKVWLFKIYCCVKLLVTLINQFKQNIKKDCYHFRVSLTKPSVLHVAMYVQLFLRFSLTKRFVVAFS